MTSKNILKESISMKNKLKISFINYFCHSSTATPEELFIEISNHRTSWSIGKVSASNLLTLDLPESTHTLSDNIPMKLSLSGTEHLRFYLEWKRYHPTVDTWSVGCILFELAHKKVPFLRRFINRSNLQNITESLEPQQSP